MKKLILAFLTTGFLGAAASADYIGTVTQTGCQAVSYASNPGQCFVFPSSNPPGCNGVIYIKFDTNGYWKAEYATALVAQVTGKNLHIIYTTASNQCTATFVSLN